MKNIYAVLLFCSLSFSFQAQDFWSIRDSVNGPGRAVSVVFVAYGQGWIVSGLNDTGFKRKMYSYNPFQDDWDDEPSIGGVSGDGLERGSAVGFSIKEKGYVCLGQGDFVQYAKDLWEYDAVTETWSQKADFTGEARRQAVAFTIDDYAYVGTGQAASGYKKDFYRYDAVNNAWAPIADFGGTARRQAVGFEMGGRGYVGTGDDGIYRNDFWQYNVPTGAWVQKANFGGLPRAGSVGWSMGNSAFIALGEDNTSTYRKDVWQYYYYSDTWVQRSDFMGSPRKNAIAFVVNGTAFVGTGYDGDFKDDLYGYNGILGLDEAEKNFTSTCYPNPVQKFATITLGDKKASDYKFEVFTISGVKIDVSSSLIKSGNQITFDAAGLAKGNYMYRLKHEDLHFSSVGKIVKW